MTRVDGREVEAHGTILDACHAAGVEVAAFCHRQGLSAGGHCRSCVVEADGRTVAACVTPARGVTSIVTDSEALRAYRRDLGELMRAECDPAGEVAATLAAWGVVGDRYAARPEALPRDRSHPYIHLDLDRCILCRRCVRACAEVQGQFVYSIAERGDHTRLHWAGRDFADSGCVSCGACVDACPTGAITDADREAAPRGGGNAGEASAPATATTTRTTCGYCGVGCALDVRVEDDRVVRIDPAPGPANRGHACVKGRYAHAFARHPDRLRTPLIRRAGRLEPASWDEALEHVAAGLTSRRGAVAGLSSSRCTNEENYLFQKWLRATLGTHDVDCCARVCHAPSAAGMRAAFGTGAATNSLDDIERADLILVVGANPTEAHPVVGARVRQAVLRGTRLIVIDPRRTELAELADVHLQVRPGANVPLLNALACAMIEAGLTNRAFLASRADGGEAHEAFVRASTPESVADVTGVAAARVREAAWLYGTAERPMMMHGLGVTEHLQGSEAVMLLCNLALLAGAIGRPGAGVNPLRGQNNVQGAADMGCQPDQLPGYGRVDDPAVRERFERAWGVSLPSTPGRTLPQMYDAARRGEVRAMVLFGEDVLQTDPDSGRTRQALEALEFLVVMELFETDTTRLAHVVLPGASVLEKSGTFTNGERRIQRVRAALPPLPDCRPDWRILAELTRACGGTASYAGPSAIMDEIASVAPNYAGVSYAALDPEGLQWPVPHVGHPGTPILHVDGFPRGRGLLSRVEYVPSPGLGGALTLMTGRVLEHYNAGSMTRRTPNRALRPRDELEIHPRDAAARGLEDGAPVVVRSAFGEARAWARVTTRVAPGSLFLSFHFPETGANHVTGDVRDRRSDCPEYKVTAVEVSRG